MIDTSGHQFSNTGSSLSATDYSYINALMAGMDNGVELIDFKSQVRPPPVPVPKNKPHHVIIVVSALDLIIAEPGKKKLFGSDPPRDVIRVARVQYVQKLLTYISTNFRVGVKQGLEKRTSAEIPLQHLANACNSACAYCCGDPYWPCKGFAISCRDQKGYESNFVHPPNLFHRKCLWWCPLSSLHPGSAGAYSSARAGQQGCGFVKEKEVPTNRVH